MPHVEEYSIIVLDGETTVCRLSELFPATDIETAVRAHNVAGWSPWSTRRVVRTADEVPDGMDPPGLLDSTAIACNLAWDEPLNYGKPITKYEIEFREESKYGEPDEWIKQREQPNDIEMTAVGLDPGTYYSFRVRACTDNLIAWT